jgi:GT2 family glycosyltransferase
VIRSAAMEHAESGPREPLVSVVFLAYNRREQLGISLDHILERTDYPADRLEVIVVDNASTDGTAEFVRTRYPGVQLIRNPENVGVSGWNVGMATARGDWLLALDDDCYITGDGLRTAVERAIEHDADLVSFLVASSEEDGYFNSGNFNPGLLGFWGCSALFSRRAIDTEPFFDPNLFLWANEVELTMRLLDRGLRHLWLPEVVSVHQKGLPDDSLSLRFHTFNHRHWAYAAGKLLQPGDAIVVLWRLLLRTALDARQRDPRLIGILPKIVAGFIHGLRFRRPMRPKVSRVYREVCSDFASPLPYLRTPMQRLRSIGNPAARQRFRDERRGDRLEREVRDRFYPTEAAVLEL